MKFIINKLSFFLWSKNPKSCPDIKILQYGIEITLITLLQILSVMILSVLFADIFYAFIYLLFYIPIRIYSGGYHASTHLGCFSITNLLFLNIILITKFIPDSYCKIISIIIILICFPIIFFFTPIINPNNPISPSKKTKYKFISRIYILAESIITILISLIFTIDIYVLVASLSIANVAFLMVVSIVQKYLD